MNVAKKPFIKLKLDDELEMNLDNIINDSQLPNKSILSNFEHSSEESIDLPSTNIIGRNYKTNDMVSKIKEINLQLEKRKCTTTNQSLVKPEGDRSPRLSGKTVKIQERQILKVKPYESNSFKISKNSKKESVKPKIKEPFKLSMKRSEPLKMLPNKFKEITEQALKTRQVNRSKVSSKPNSVSQPKISNASHFNNGNVKVKVRFEAKSYVPTMSSSKKGSAQTSFHESRNKAHPEQEKARERTKLKSSTLKLETKRANTTDRVSRGDLISRV